MNNNLDYYCAKIGQGIAEENKASDYKNQIMKSLGVLQEDGLFAYAIHLESEGNKISKNIMKNSVKLLNEIGLITDNKTKDFRTNILNLTKTNLDKIFLTKQVLEKMLIYAKYHAHALNKDKK